MTCWFPETDDRQHLKQYHFSLYLKLLLTRDANRISGRSFSWTPCVPRRRRQKKERLEV